MVDLHESLRPSGTVPPLPVSELANRVATRKKRRRVATTGLAFGFIGIGALVAANIPAPNTNTATVADGAEITTSSEQDQPTTTVQAPLTTTEPTEPDRKPAPDSEAAPSAEPAPDSDQDPNPDLVPDPDQDPDDSGQALEPSTTPGVRTVTTTTSSWEDGYCMQVSVINEAEQFVDWQVVMDLGGDIAELWNASATPHNDDLTVFSGEDGYNTTIQAGTTTSFGACVDTHPPEQP